jgi:hypothetical protein
MNNQNWKSLLQRIRRIVLLSLIPTGALAVGVITSGVTGIAVLGYDVAGNWIPLLVLVLSTQGVVVSKYLTLTIGNLNPKSLTIVSAFTGTIVTVGVILMYNSFGISGTFVVISLTNVSRAFCLALLTRRISTPAVHH